MSTNLINTKLIIGALAGLTLAGTAFGQTPDPRQVSIESLRYSGSGCPQGSAVANLSDDRQALTLLFDDFLVAGDNGAQERKNCQVDLTLAHPPGWTYALFCVDYRGFADIERGMVGTHEAKVSFPGSGLAPQSLGRYRQVGPFSDDYSRLTQVSLDEARFSSCDNPRQRLRLNTTIGVRPRNSNRGGSALLTVDSLDGYVGQHYGIAWRRCESGPIRTNTKTADIAGGKIWTLANNGTPFVRNARGGQFTALPGLFTELDAISRDEAYAVGTRRQFLKYTAGNWRQLPGLGIDIAGIPGGYYCFIGTNNKPVCGAPQEGFRELPGLGRRIAVENDSQRTVWMLGTNNMVLFGPNGQWQLPGGRELFARDVIAGQDGEVYLISLQGQLQHIDRQTGGLTNLASGVKSAAINARGNILIVNSRGELKRL